MITWSILVPCYNEAQRGKKFLFELADFVSSIKNKELILIDDGSTDDTINLLERVAAEHSFIRILKLRPNRGKGGAIKAGIFKAKGRKIIFIDADGSIAPDQLPRMMNLLEKHPFVIASRYFERERIKQPFSRVIVGTIFNTYVNLLFRIHIKDTLCGFKGFDAAIARKLFKNLISMRWIFDVEIFYRARKNRIPIKQFSIDWQHCGGSKITFFEPVRMAWRLLVLRMKI
ncbi:MAG: glycosyltransferase [Nanoarchaeota archaeon]